ncbi:MAG: helicase RepA family protein [Parachlamydia sp.]|nr:helicase RepA family protein [Parachlamydia sp.]
MTIADELINGKKYNAIQIRPAKGAYEALKHFNTDLKNLGCWWNSLVNGGMCWSCPISSEAKIASLLKKEQIKADLKPHWDEHFEKPVSLQKVDLLYNRINLIEEQHFKEEMKLVVDEHEFQKEIQKRELDENSPEVIAKKESFEERRKKQGEQKSEADQLRNAARLHVQKSENTSNNIQNDFHFNSAHSLLQNPPKSNWLIKNYMDVGSLCVLFGEPGSMKSFAAIDIGLCVASGRDWHGAPIRKPGSVFYIAGEGLSGISKRLRAWMLANHVEAENLAFFVSSRSAQFLDVDSVVQVIKSIDELQAKHGKPILVIIDTLNRNFGNGDENNTPDMTAFVNAIDISIKGRYGCTVLIVHHSPLNNRDRARGSTVLHAAADWEFRLTKQKDTRLLEATKVKDFDQPASISFKPITVQLTGWIDADDGEMMTSCILQKTNAAPSIDKSQGLSNSAKTALDILVKLIQDDPRLAGGIHFDVWRNAVYEASSSSKADTKRQAFNRGFKELKEGGYVENQEDYWWPIA